LGVPLIDLTKKGAFRWSEDTHVAFYRMEKVMSTCPILSLLDFTQPFVLECDTSSEGIRAVLMQNRHLIDFESKKLRDPERIYIIYYKEMLAIMHALAKFK